jgi:hypothetical protein
VHSFGGDFVLQEWADVGVLELIECANEFAFFEVERVVGDRGLLSVRLNSLSERGKNKLSLAERAAREWRR